MEERKVKRANGNMDGLGSFLQLGKSEEDTPHRHRK